MNDKPTYRIWIAGGILALYLIISVFMIYFILGTDTVGEKQWTQVVVIFNAVAALATTASGVLFGAEVQQTNVRFANLRAEAHAGEAERKRAALVQALPHLEPERGQAGTAEARSILQQALLSPPPSA